MRRNITFEFSFLIVHDIHSFVHKGSQAAQPNTINMGSTLQREQENKKLCSIVKKYPSTCRHHSDIKVLNQRRLVGLLLSKNREFGLKPIMASVLAFVV
jgi:hypothetical protein